VTHILELEKHVIKGNQRIGCLSKPITPAAGTKRQSGVVLDRHKSGQRLQFSVDDDFRKYAVSATIRDVG
jgi:hypothetical protein